MNADPVFQVTSGYNRNAEFPLITGSWYFWDETWTDAIGPYNTEVEARKASTRYAETL